MADEPVPPARSGPRTDLGEPGLLTVFGADEQDAHPVDVDRWVGLAERVLGAMGVRGNVECSLLFVDEDAMTDLNRRFMGEAEPTDVLAFPIEEEPIEAGRWPDGGTSGPDRDPEADDEMPTLLGDVVICPAVASRNAPTHAGTYDDELALLVVHGLLHILGYDHDFPEEAEKMQAKERELLQAFHRRLPR